MVWMYDDVVYMLKRSVIVELLGEVACVWQCGAGRVAWAGVCWVSVRESARESVCRFPVRVLV